MKELEQTITVQGCPDCGSFDIFVNQDLPIGIYKCAKCGRAYNPNGRTTLDQQLFELMCRAPEEIPDWFEVDIGPEPRIEKWRNREAQPGVFVSEPDLSEQELTDAHAAWNKYQIEKRRQRLLQWPSAYARMVMEAAGKP